LQSALRRKKCRGQISVCLMGGFWGRGEKKRHGKLRPKKGLIQGGGGGGGKTTPTQPPSPEKKKKKKVTITKTALGSETV